jgi:hypothetical protein
MKKQIILHSLLLALLLTNCTPSLLPNISLGSGEVIHETRPVSNFHAITLTGLGDLTITQGATEALTVTAEDNIMPHIKSVVEDGRLTLGFDAQSWLTLPRTTKPIQFVLTLKQLDNLTLAGQGNIQAENIKTAALKITLGGQGDIRIANLEAANLVCTLTGKGNISIPHLKATQSACTILGEGNIDLAGQLTSQALAITGKGNYQAGDLDSQTTKVTINGMGDATLWVREHLDIEIFGKGAVAYYGNPTVSKNVFGSADVRALGNK